MTISKLEQWLNSFKNCGGIAKNCPHLAYCIHWSPACNYDYVWCLRRADCPEATIENKSYHYKTMEELIENALIPDGGIANGR